VGSTNWAPQPPQDHRPSQLSSNQAPTLPQLEPTRPLGLGRGYHEPNRLQKPLPPKMTNSKPQPQPMITNQGYKDQAPPQIRYDGQSVPRKDLAQGNYRGSSVPASNPSPVMSPQQQHHFRQQQQQIAPIQSPVSAGSSQSRQSQRPPQHTMSSQSLRHDAHTPLSAHSMGPPTPLSAHSVGPPTPSSTISAGPSTPKPSTGPPKKQGPATFEEMGIPASKESNECVSDLILLKYSADIK